MGKIRAYDLSGAETDTSAHRALALFSNAVEGRLQDALVGVTVSLLFVQCFSQASRRMKRIDRRYDHCRMGACIRHNGRPRKRTQLVAMTHPK